MSRRVSSIPSSDHEFRDAASEALQRLDDIGSDIVAAVLADHLRASYPAVEVRRQEILARLFDDDLWYAYRDGKPRSK